MTESGLFGRIIKRRQEHEPLSDNRSGSCQAFMEAAVTACHLIQVSHLFRLYVDGPCVPGGAGCMQKTPNFPKPVQIRAIDAAYLQSKSSKTLGIQCQKASGEVALRLKTGVHNCTPGGSRVGSKRGLSVQRSASRPGFGTRLGSLSCVRPGRSASEAKA